MLITNCSIDAMFIISYFKFSAKEKVLFLWLLWIKSQSKRKKMAVNTTDQFGHEIKPCVMLITAYYVITILYFIKPIISIHIDLVLFLATWSIGVLYYLLISW